MLVRHCSLGFFVLALICWLDIKRLIAVEESPTVRVKNGTLEGTFMTSRKGRTIIAFKGIPYAQPPLGELRFEPPQPLDAWTGVRPAKNDSEMCTQRDIYTHQENVTGSEDCLYLNVYTPKLPDDDNNAIQESYPVMVWFHGGGWIAGSSHSNVIGPKFLLDHDVVLVTPHYRLGPLGFLSTEDLIAPGNQGMKDQVQSLKWVRENIAAFGGDPDKVTIFGESAGGASTHYHMTSPLSRGLFHRVISQSGFSLCPWGLTRSGTARKHAERIGTLLKCPIDNSIALVNCLKKKNPVDIIATDRAFQIFGTCPIIPFRVVVEPSHPGAFITETASESLMCGNVADVPWMTGTVSQEGALKVAEIYGLKEKEYVKLLDKKFMELAPMSLLYGETCPAELIDNATRSIRTFYLGDEDINEPTRMKLVDMYTDAWILSAADNSIRRHFAVVKSPIYYYYFAYKGTFTLSPMFGDSERDYGVSHADELQYLFPIAEQLSDTPPTEDDYRMVDVMTRLWVNFGKFGNPTPEESSKSLVGWSPVKSSELEYLYIGGAKNISMKNNLLPERLNFWANLSCFKKVELANRKCGVVQDSATSFNAFLSASDTNMCSTPNDE